MSNLLDKLNVLVKASLNSVLSGSTSQPRLGPEHLGKGIDQEVTALRKQIDEALTQEDNMQARLDQLQQRADGYDRQAEEALQRGDEANARYLAQQMQRQQQLEDMVRAELEQHRRSTSEFI